MSCTYPIRAGPALAERAALLLRGLDLLRGKFKEAAARAVGGAVAAWVADLVRLATGGKPRPARDPLEDLEGLEEEDRFGEEETDDGGWGWRAAPVRAPVPDLPAAGPSWPWLLALSVPALRLGGPASLAASLAP
jgi:hypothetical protein